LIRVLKISNTFTEDQKRLMRDNSKKFSIERIDSNSWNWKEVYSKIFNHTKKVKQPGEPVESEFSFENLAKEQILNFVLSPKNCNVTNVHLELNNYKKIKLPMTIKKGQILKYKWTDEAVLYNANWGVVKKFKINSSDFKISSGKNNIIVDCSFDSAESNAKLKVELRTSGEKTRIVYHNKL
jgi:hypothetical protein